MNVIELEKIRNKFNLSREEMAEKLNISIETLNTWEYRKKEIPKSRIITIKYVFNTYFDEIDEEITNTVEKPIKGFETIPNKNGNSFSEHPNGGWVITAPMIPFNAHASFIEVYEDEKGYMQFENASFKVDLFGKGRYVAFTVIGDSMNGGGIDDTKHGAEVLARELQKTHWRDGFGETEYGWIIVTESGIMHKDIVSNIDENGCIKLHSRNPSPEYKDFEIEINSVHSIWKVIKRTF